MSLDESPGVHPDHDHGRRPFRFCPVCGHPLHRESIKPSEPERLVCSRCQFVFYLDPKVAVGTIINMDGGIVLSKRGIRPAYGRWVIPGGYVERGETLEQACVRETREEVRLDVEVQELLNVYSYPGRPVIVIVYTVKVVGGLLGAGDETLEAKIFPYEQIPWTELAFPSTADALRDYIKRRRMEAGEGMPA